MVIGNDLDPLGLKTATETGKLVTKSIVDFFSKICANYAEEYGADLALSRRAKRLNRIHKIVQESKGILTHDGNTLQLSADERVVYEIVENGSKTDDDLLLSMWGGLLAASCLEGIPSDSNLIYVNILKNLTSMQAKIIEFVCKNCSVVLISNLTLIGVKMYSLKLKQLTAITGSNDWQQINSEIDFLATNGLLCDDGKGTTIEIKAVNEDLHTHISLSLKPSILLLDLYCKTQGFKGNIQDFYRNQAVPMDNSHVIPAGLTIE